MSIKIGVLFYHSTVYPNMSNDLIKGFQSVLPTSLIRDNFFQFIPEYVMQATTKQVEISVQKLLSFHQADIVFGLLNYKAIPTLVPMFNRHRRIGLFSDMGEYIPYTNTISDIIFFNSFQLWQSEYAMGLWAQQQFGDKGSIAMGFFDCGFHLQSAFRQGTVMAGSSEIDYTIMYDPGTYHTDIAYKTNQYIDALDENNLPSFVHAIFCGYEAVDFLKTYRQSKLYGKVPLIVSAHMSSEDILQEIDIDMEFYSASMYNYHSPDAVNQQFKQKYIQATGEKPTIFSLMGYELGLGLLETMPALQKRDFKAVADTLKKINIKSPRGIRNFYADDNYALPIIDIEKISIHNKVVHKIVIEQGRALRYDSVVYEEIHKEHVSGWQNPYLCV